MPLNETEIQMLAALDEADRIENEQAQKQQMLAALDEADRLEDQAMQEQAATQSGGQFQTAVEGLGRGITLNELPRVQAAADVGIQSAQIAGGNEALNTIKEQNPEFFQLQPGEREVDRMQRIRDELLKSYEPGIADAFLASEGFGLEKPQTYEQSFQEQVNRGQAQEQAYPTTSGLSEFAGNLVTGIATSPLMPVGRIPGAGLAGRAARTAASAVEGAGFGLLQRPPDEGATEFDLAKRGEQALWGAGFGGAIQGGVESIKPLAKLSKWLGKKAISTFTRIDEEVIDTYIKNFERLDYLSKRGQTLEGVNRAKNAEEIGQEIETFVNKLKNDVGDAKITKENAKDALDHAKFLSAEELKVARRKLDFALDGKMTQLKEASNIGTIAEDVYSGIGDLKNKVIAGSRAASDILDSGGSNIKTKDIIRMADRVVNKLKVKGQIFGKQRQSVARDIEALKTQLSEIGEEIEPRQVKEIIKSLDEEINFLVNSNDFAGAKDGASAKIRRGISELLKDTFPQYRDAMQEVAKNTDLLSKLNKNFKDVDSITSKLRGITGPTNKSKRQLIENLGDKIGVDYRTALDKASRIKKTLSSKEGKFNLKSNLDEFKEVERLERVVKSPDKKEFTIAQKRLDQAMKKLRMVQSLDKDPSSKVQAFISTQGKNQVQRNRKLFESLSKLSDKDFVGMIEDAGILSKFRQDITRGSKNVNFWGAITVGAATLAGGGGVPAALVVGPIVGYINDRYGPRIAREILDVAIKVGKNPTVRRIDKFAKNPTVNRFLKEELAKISAIRGSRTERK